MSVNRKFLEIERRTDVYRASTIGKALFESLKELVDDKRLTPSLAGLTLEEFDRCTANILQDLPRTYAAVFQAEKVVNYGLIGDQWSIKLQNVLFSYIDQNIDDDITMVHECVLFCSKPILFSLDVTRASD